MLQKFQIRLSICEIVTSNGQAGNKFVMTEWRILNSNKDQMQKPDGNHANNTKDFQRKNIAEAFWLRKTDLAIKIFSMAIFLTIPLGTILQSNS